MHSGAAGGHLGRVQTLAGHAADVSCFHWGADDRRCWTAADGYLFEWDVSSTKRLAVAGGQAHTRLFVAATVSSFRV